MAAASRTSHLAVTVGIASLLAAVPVWAHGIEPSPEGSPFRVLLQDRLDDCGPEAAPAQDCHGSDALIGLALQEKADGASDLLVFRFYLDGGKPTTQNPVTTTLAFASPAGSKTLAVRTTDDHTFGNAGGFDAVTNAFPLGGGNRFAVDGTVALRTLGLQVGDRITNFKVESTSGASVGDFMPGGCHNTVGDCTAGNTDEYVAGGGQGSFRLDGPSYYATLSGPARTQEVPAGADGLLVQVTLRNDLAEAQNFALSLSGATAVTAGFHSGEAGAGTTYAPTLQVKLPAKASSSIHLHIAGPAGAQGTVTVQASTDRGGRETLAIPYRIAGTPNTSTGPHSPSTHGSPALSPVALVAFFALLVLTSRRT